MCPIRCWSNIVSIALFSVSWLSLVILLFLIFITPVSAAPVTYETVRVGPGQYAPSGTVAPVTVNVKAPGVSKFHQIVPVASPSTIGKLGRSLVRGGGIGLVVTGLIEGLGYLVDQATGQIQKVDYESTWPSSPVIYASAQLGCDNSPDICWTNPNTGQDYGFKCPAANPVIAPAGFAQFKCFPPGTEPQVLETIIDLSPEDYQRIDNQMNTALSLAEKMAILRLAMTKANLSGTVNSDSYPVSLSSSNPDTQQLFTDWPQLQQSLQNLVNAEIAAYLATVNPNFQPSPDEQVIVDTGSELPPVDLTEPEINLELPAFCEWASFICQPFVGGDQPDVPMLDLEAPSYDSGLPQSASCPPPVVIDTQWFGSLELSYEPACQFASGIRVPLLTICYFVAGFIVVGVRR